MSASSRPQADCIFFNGKIITVDQRFSIAEAVAIRDGRFCAVGSQKDVSPHAGQNTIWIDLDGRSVLPGLIDTHAHVEEAGLLRSTVCFEEVTTVREAQARLKRMVDATKSGEWIVGRSWHPQSQLQEKRLLTRWEIDQVAPEHPVYLPIGHFAMANSVALDVAAITRDTPDPAGGKIERDSRGEPTGILVESAERLVCSCLPPVSSDTRLVQLGDAVKYFNQFGITSAVSAAVNPADLRAYQKLKASGKLSLRLSIMFAPTGNLNPQLSLCEWETLFSTIGVSSGFGDDWLNLSAVKLQVDGGMTLRTAAMRDGYPDDPEFKGVIVIAPDRLSQLVSIANRFDWRVGVHAVGDAAIDHVLDAYEYAHRQKSIADRRFIIIHASMMRADQMIRAKALGVRADVQSMFLWDKASAVARFLGKPNANRAIPLKTMIDNMGLDNLGAGTDFSTNLLNPFINIYVMVTRKDKDGSVYGEGEAVTREEAIRLYTSAAARYSFEENTKGSIEVGKLADLVVLSDDPLTVPDERIKDIVALRTVVNGGTVFLRSESVV